MKLQRTPIPFVLLGSLMAASFAGAQNLISNGSFESPMVPNEDADGGVTVVAPGMLPGGWEVISGSVDILRRDGATQYQVPDGFQALDLTGAGTRGTIRRTLQLEQFVVYRLSFWLAGNPTCEVGLKRITLIVDNVLFTQPTFNTTGWSVTNMGWTFYEFAFAGLDEEVGLQISSLSGTQCGPMVDDFRFEECLRVTEHPSPAAACIGGAAMFSMGVVGDDIQYQWRRNNMPVGEGGSFSGASTPVLTVNPVTQATAGTYTCVVFSNCGELSSLGATLTAIPAPCPGDANSDQTADFADITSVLQFWGFDYRPGTGPGDANCDGVVTFADVTRVLENWGMTCF